MKEQTKRAQQVFRYASFDGPVVACSEGVEVGEEEINFRPSSTSGTSSTSSTSSATSTTRTTSTTSTTGTTSATGTRSALRVPPVLLGTGE